VRGSGGPKASRNPGEAWGLVPDGVASISARFASGAEREVPVSDNYFQFSRA
jgi:hypothetical protein